MHPVFDRKEAIVKIYPEVADIYLGTCADCMLTKVSNKIRELGIRSGSPITLDELKPIVKYDKAPILKATPAFVGAPTEGFFIDPETGELREACMDCVIKHLCQALILVNESRQTYDHHIGYAQAHMDAAVRSARPDKAGDVIVAAEAVKACGLNRSKEQIMLAQASVKRAAEQLSLPIPLNKWLAIGHMAEAGDEIAAEFPKLALLIRDERLKYTSIKNYVPSFASLLSKVEALISDKNEQLGYEAPDAATDRVDK